MAMKNVVGDMEEDVLGHYHVLTTENDKIKKVNV